MHTNFGSVRRVGVETSSSTRVPKRVWREKKGIERGVEERIAAKTGVIDATDSNGLAAAEYDDVFGEPVRGEGSWGTPVEVVIR